MIKKWFYKLTNMREGEEGRALLMFAYIFLLLLTINILKPIRNSLFLTKFGVSQLPYAYILVAISAAFFISVYTKYSKSVRLTRLILVSSSISIFTTIAFWFMLRPGAKLSAGSIVYLFYIWEALVAVLWVSQFWLLAGYVFNAREARRLFGFLGAGAIAGSIAGGYLTSYTVSIFGTRNLILMCVFPLAICIGILATLRRSSARATYQELLRQRKTGWSGPQQNPLNLILQSRHLSYLAALIGIGVIVSNLVDYQYSALVIRQVKNQEALTAFLGFWLSNLSVISLLIQLFFTSRLLLALGVGSSLYFLPLGVLAGTFTILFRPTLWSGVFTKVTEGAFKFSINRSALELLFVPIPPTIKNQTKAFIDVFVDSFANGIGGLLLIVFSLGLGLAPDKIGFITIGMICIWGYIIIQMKREYLNSFRVALEKRSIDLEDQRVDLKDPAVLNSIISILKGNNERPILYALRLAEDSKSDLLVPHLSRLLSHPSPEIKTQVLGMILNYPGLDFAAEAQTLTEDPNFDVQVAAIRYLCSKSPDTLATVGELLKSKDYRLRCAVLMYAAKEGTHNKDFRKRFSLKESLDSLVRELDEKVIDEPQRESLKADLTAILGAANDPELYPHLQDLLTNGSPRIVEAAVQSAGKTKAKEFVPFLIQSLSQKNVRKHARNALAEYGEEIIDTLEKRLSDPDLRNRIPGVLGMIPDQKAVDLLQKHLEDKDPVYRGEVLKALNKLRTRNPNLKFNQDYIEKNIVQEAKEYRKIHSLYYRLRNILSQKKEEPTVRRAQHLLLKALQERLLEKMERIFRLLGLKYEPDDMFNAYRASTSSKLELQANAVEFMDNLLQPHLKKYILPILDASHEDFSADQDDPSRKSLSETESIHTILESDDKWLVICALYLMAESKNRELASYAGKFKDYPDPTVQETLTYAMDRLQSQSP